MEMHDLRIEDMQTQWSSFLFPANTFKQLLSSNPQRVAVYTFSASGSSFTFVPGGGGVSNITTSGPNTFTAVPVWYTISKDGPVVQLDFWGQIVGGDAINVLEIIRIPRSVSIAARRIFTRDGLLGDVLQRQTYLDRLNKVLADLRKYNGDLR